MVLVGDDDVSNVVVLAQQFGPRLRSLNELHTRRLQVLVRALVIVLMYVVSSTDPALGL